MDRYHLVPPEIYGSDFMPKALDITGQVFGNLKALSKEPSQSGKTYWLCECLLCGNKKVVQTSHLVQGNIKSCGCIPLENNFSKTGSLEERICILCKKPFIPNVASRRYCYECSPKGLPSKDGLRFRKRKIKNMLIEYKGGKCQKCGYDKCQGALQFHHRNPQEKEFGLSNFNLNDTNFSIEKIYEEVDKCDLLCANCHFEVHYKDNDDMGDQFKGQNG